MTVWDNIIVLIYIIALYLIAYFTMREKKLASPEVNLSEKKMAEIQFLAGRQVGMIEAVFSIVATEFSAMTFVQLPALVILGRKGLLWGLLGVIIGRIFISRFLLKNFYRSGLTVFDALARGVKNYPEVNKSPKRAQRFMASIYFFSKVLSVSAAMYLGVSFISRFYGLPYYVVLIGVITLTSLYTIWGGLRVVMRTDILQFWAIFLGGLTLSYIVFENLSLHSPLTLFQLANHAAFGSSDWTSILVGITAGFVSDFSTHGVEQEFVQKLKACKTPTIASKAVKFSTFFTLGLQIVFIGLGALLLMRTPGFQGDNSSAIEYFMQEALTLLGPGSRGFIVVALLSATMSSLDSSLNALSCVLWNDILPTAKITRYPILIKLDNVVVVLFVSLFAYFVGQNPIYINGFLKLNYFVLLPLVCCFIIRFICYPWMKFSFGVHTVFFVILSCILGWVINTVYFSFPSEVAIFMSLFFSICSIIFYEKLCRWI